ncbi:unnamed protein product [Diabrotica balteata]|uniref:Uncharacterized protein n=1 Tax=Diabrotica balteata TaxID=107213 RepID=A0A9N9XDU6_DIABA|nr:unnamed protein product [Diabrotica balteata]
MHEESVQPELERDQNQPVSEKLEEVNVPESKVNIKSKPTPIIKDSDKSKTAKVTKVNVHKKHVAKKTKIRFL